MNLLQGSTHSSWGFIVSWHVGHRTLCSLSLCSGATSCKVRVFSLGSELLLWLRNVPAAGRADGAKAHHHPPPVIRAGIMLTAQVLPVKDAGKCRPSNLTFKLDRSFNVSQCPIAHCNGVTNKMKAQFSVFEPNCWNAPQVGEALPVHVQWLCLKNGCTINSKSSSESGRHGVWFDGWPAQSQHSQTGYSRIRAI